MEDKQWIENIAKYRLISWLLVIALLGVGLKIASVINGLAYGEHGADPSSTYWLTIAIYFAGYSLWGSAIATNVASKVFTAFIKALFRKLFKNRKLDDNDIKEVSDQVFNEETQMKMLAGMRKATRNFLRAGFMFGFILGLIHYFTVEPSLGVKGFGLFLGYGLAWGYLWYQLAWHGLIPLPSGEEA